MPKSNVWIFGSTSRAQLATCHTRLQAVVNRALELSLVDMTVVSGHRSIEEQQALYAQGRTEPGDIVTHVDGVRRKSRHNYMPSLAVDLAPYVRRRGIVWNDPLLFDRIEQAMKRAAAELKTPIEWGGDWTRFVDKPHWQLKGSPSRWIPKGRA